MDMDPCLAAVSDGICLHHPTSLNQDLTSLSDQTVFVFKGRNPGLTYLFDKTTASCLDEHVSTSQWRVEAPNVAPSPDQTFLVYTTTSCMVKIPQNGTGRDRHKHDPG